MPKAGFKSITVSENVYKKFFDVYEKSRKELELKGITSFSGYLTSMMEEMMIRYEAFAKHAPFIQKIAIDQNRVILKDNKCNRIVEVLLKDRELQCLLDEKSDCVHVGFVYSLPELYSIIRSKAIKVPAHQIRDCLPVLINLLNRMTAHNAHAAPAVSGKTWEA